jgi:hypothetical protein
MRNRLRLCLVLLFIGLASSGTTCRVKPLHNPPPVTFARHDDTAVRTAIMRALANRGWLAEPEGPGTIRGILNIREHQAVISIHYTPTSYQITYVSSQNLNYSNTGGTERIHGNYNSWIQNLMADIDTLLAGGHVGATAQGTIPSSQ